MPDTEISKLVELVSADIQGTDPLAIADLSAVETKKVTVKSLIEKGVDLLDPDEIDPDKIDWDNQAANQINGSAIKNRSIDAVKIVADSLTAAEIAPNAIGSSELANGAVDTAAILDQAVTAAKIQNNSIGDSQITDGGIGTTSLADGAVTRVKMTLVANDIDGSVIADNSLTNAEIGPNAVGASELADNAVDTAAIQNLAVTGGKIANNTIGDAQIINGGIGTSSLADGAVTRLKMTLVANDIDGSVIADNSITVNEIGANAVGSSELADNAVDTAAIQDLAVTGGKVANNTLGDAQIIDGGIGTSSLADGAVTRRKMTLVDNDIAGSVIADNSITANEIAPDAVGASELANNAVDTAAIQNAAVTNAKLAASSVSSSNIIDGTIATTDLANGLITEPKLATNSVTTAKVVDANITAAKLAPNLPGSILGNGEIDTVQLADDAVTTAKINDLAVSTDKLATGAVTDAKVSNVSGSKLIDSTVTANKLSATAFSGGIELDGTVQHTNDIAAGSSAGITWDANGHVTGFGQVPASDLPLATATTVGAISVPSGSGLTVSGAGAIDHVTLVNASSVSGISYDEHGHITATRSLISTDLPNATATNKGAVSVPTDNDNPLIVSGDAELTHQASGIVAGTYASVDVDIYGHVVAGDVVLAANQVPNLDASKITTGQFGSARIADGSITGPKHADYATCFMQEETPGGDGEFLGQFWYQPSTAQLRVYSRGSGPQSIWMPVGFGALQQQNLRVGFTYDASNSTIVSITQYGAAAGFAAGDAIPTATNAMNGIYGVCVVPGNVIDVLDLDGTNHTAGDWILAVSETVGWIHVDVTSAGGGGGAQVLNDLLDVEIGGGGLPALEDQQILRYRSDIGQWVNTDLTTAAHVADAPPSNAPNGALWWDVESGRLMIYYDDGDTAQWVVATPESGLTGGNEPPVPVKEVLNDLDNVNALKSDGVLLVYNASNVQWESTGLVDGGAFTGALRVVSNEEDLASTRDAEVDVLNDLTDVNAADTDGAFLQYSDGAGTWVAQVEFDAGQFPVILKFEDPEAEFLVGTRAITQLNDFLDVQADKDDTAYLVYNDGLNRWESTVIINGGSF